MQMPTYEFHCRECGYSFDFFSTVAEKEQRQRERTITCEQCGSDKVEQVFGGFSLQSGKGVVSSSGGGGGCCGGTPRC
jgi:putative FmdB family regulatory protein